MVDLSIAMLVHQRVMAFTLWLFHIAMENCPFIDVKNDDLPIKNRDSPYVK